jgi:hypothetical protein
MQVNEFKIETRIIDGAIISGVLYNCDNANEKITIKNGKSFLDLYYLVQRVLYADNEETSQCN